MMSMSKQMFYNDWWDTCLLTPKQRREFYHYLLSGIPTPVWLMLSNKEHYPVTYKYKPTTLRVLTLDPDNNKSVFSEVGGYLVTQPAHSLFVHRAIGYNHNHKLAVLKNRLWNAVDPLSRCHITWRAESRHEATVLAFKAIERLGAGAYAELIMKRAAEMCDCEEVQLVESD